MPYALCFTGNLPRKFDKLGQLDGYFLQLAGFSWLASLTGLIQLAAGSSQQA
jgi:hypothetical protein